MPSIKTHDGRTIELPDEEEDRRLTQQAREDDTLHSEAELAAFQPFEQSPLPESFKRAVRRGRPRKARRKVLVSIRYSPEVIDHFRATGKGWQTRMDEALRQWIEEHGGS